MKIVHVCMNRNGGAANAAFRLHQALLTSGVNSWFYTLEPRGVQQTVENWICWPGLQKNFRYFKHRNLARLLEASHPGRRKQRLENRRLLMGISSTIVAEFYTLPDASIDFLLDPFFDDVDIIHLHWVACFLPYSHFFKMARSRKIKLVWTLHDLLPVQGIFHYKTDIVANPQVTDLELRVERYKAQCIDDYGKPISAIAPSTYILEQAKGSRLAKYFQFQIIPYQLPNKGKQNLAYPPLLLTSKAQVTILIVCESMDHQRKGMHLLNGVFECFPGIEFWLVGHSNNIIAESANVKSFGFIADRHKLDSIFSSCDALLLPSIEDNLPNVMLEAFVAGKPVLAFNTGGMAEYIVNGINGITVPLNEPNGISQLLHQFLKTRTTFSPKKIQKKAMEDFNEENIISKHLALYKACSR